MYIQTYVLAAPFLARPRRTAGWSSVSISLMFNMDAIPNPLNRLMDTSDAGILWTLIALFPRRLSIFFFLFLLSIRSSSGKTGYRTTASSGAINQREFSVMIECADFSSENPSSQLAARCWFFSAIPDGYRRSVSRRADFGKSFPRTLVVLACLSPNVCTFREYYDIGDGLSF
jgi:hypothetical protein